MIRGGIAIFKYIYNPPGTTLGEIQYMFPVWTDQARTLPSTEGAAAQHYLHAYIQTQDWMLLRSMSLNPDEYGWTVGVHGYEPVPTLDP